MRLFSTACLFLSIYFPNNFAQAFLIPEERKGKKDLHIDTKSRTTPSPLFRLQRPQKVVEVKPTRDRKTALSASSSIGFLGHSGLLLVSIVLVRFLYALFVPKDEESSAAGMLNRCPWHFVISHDPKQFFKDSPTWMIVCWIALWRIAKVVATKRA